MSSPTHDTHPLRSVLADALSPSRTRQEGLFRRVAGARLRQLERDRLSAALVAAERACKRGDAEARARTEAQLDALLGGKECAV